MRSWFRAPKPAAMSLSSCPIHYGVLYLLPLQSLGTDQREFLWQRHPWCSQKEEATHKDLNRSAEKQRHSTAVSLSEHWQIFATSSLAATVRGNVIARELGFVYAADSEGKYLIKRECQAFTQWDVSEQPKHSTCVLVTCLAERKTDGGPWSTKNLRGCPWSVQQIISDRLCSTSRGSGRTMDAATSFRCASTGADPLWRYLTEHDPKYEGKKKLKISGRELVSVPVQVFGLDQLQVLEMSPERESCLRYRMELLPQEISRLRNLTCLYVDSNNLKKIPAEIGTLSHLERLTLSNNSLSSLPPEMGALQRLHSLHLANNSLTELPAPLCQLRSLTFLDVSDNKIGTIPSSIRHLEKLETLLLFFNSLESLPEEVCLLRKLHTLWLGNNHLRSLPATFGELVNLDWGYNYCSCNFEGNPLERPPPEVCSRGPAEIRDYFLSFHKTQRN